MPDLRLGNTLVQSESGEVRNETGVSHLEPKSMAVLLYLVEHHGDVVSREDLLDAVWPGVHVGDDSLTAAIIKIRRALSDDARNPTHIETIPKRGYRLISPIGTGAADQPAASVSFAEPNPRGSRGRLLAALIVLLTVIGAVLFYADSSEEASEQHASDLETSTIIVVTPFANVSGDPGQDYLALGISETILNDLARQSDLSVRQILEGTVPSSPADYILQGSIAHVGKSLRVAARLLDGENGEVLRALRFERDFDDLLAIEDEIRENMLAEIAVSIDAEEKSRRARGYTENVTAYDLFLRAQSELLVRTAETNSLARDLYRKAIVADESFARAYGGLALSYAADYRNGWGDDGAAALKSAMKFAQTAIGISPELPEQHWVIGYVLTQQRNYSEAEPHLNLAIEISPRFADAYALLGGIETYRENPTESIQLLRDAMRLNPDAGYLYFLLIARAYYFMGDYELAQINLVEALSRNPENVECHLYLAATLLHLNRTDDAEWEAMEVLGIDPDFSLEAWSQTYPMARGEQLERLLADLREAGLS